MRDQITIFTAVYNTEKFLPQCLDSVIHQTYQNFKHIVVDNGCTDGCTGILKEYAAQYPWVRLIRYEENRHDYDYGDWIDTPYFCNLDSDDWWEPDMLENLVGLMERHHLDLAVTGAVNYFEDTRTERVLRKLDQTIILTQQQFAQQYPLYWTFPSAVWASLKKTALYRQARDEIAQNGGWPYGTDTINMLSYIKQCRNIGIDDAVRYHYRIHKKSVSFLYNPRRFDANVFCYERLRAFMELHQTFDGPKQEWLKRVHLSAMNATLQLLWDANLSTDEKLTECVRIISHPLTQRVLTIDCAERTQWHNWITAFAGTAICCGQNIDTENLRTVLETVSPQCAPCVRAENIPLFRKEPQLLNMLLKDDQDGLACAILSLIQKRSYSKQYDLGQMMHGLIPARSLLSDVADARFFREYADSCRMILKEDYGGALEQTSGILLEGKCKYGQETFLQIYLSLAALEGHAEAFVFGKLRLAQFYLRQSRQEECRAVLAELREMGLTDHEEVNAICLALDGRAQSTMTL